jgi:thioesterase domain-containing protein/NAD(P)-dependent dehydrogenase (short-subunit alcohol dehydrogenase family)/acyl carrier protein
MGTDRVVVATPGKTFGERLDGTWSFNFGNAEHYAQIVQYMEESVGLPNHVVLLTSTAKAIGAERKFLAPAMLMQVLGEVSSDVQVSVVTRGATGAGGGRINPAEALALGPVLVAPREFSHVQARCIDLPANRLDTGEAERLLVMLGKELRAETADTIVALTPSGRWVRRTAALPLPGVTDAPATWVRDGGVYLVTGGLGGIGQEVAEHLARAGRVKIALMSREALPPEPEWPRLLKDRPQDKASLRIARVMKLRDLGAHVMIARADVANSAEVAEAVNAVRKAFGPINGVIHGAGVMDDAPMMTKDVEAMRRVLAPKVDGALALDRAITEDLDFFVLFSSVASYLGLPGQIDYTAANAFQDAFARERAMRAKGRTVVINWNAWRDVGMAASAHKALTVGPAPACRAVHPALDGYTDTAQNRTFSAAFEGASEWLLAEHVVKGGPQVLPGTAYVELARAAFAEGRDAGAIEIANLAFVSPFRAERNEPRCLTIQVTPSSGGASIAMFAGHDTTRQQPIVTGEARVWPGAAPSPIDLAAIRARCSTRVFAPSDRRLDQTFMDFGGRWANIIQTAFGLSEALVELALPDQFHGDLPGYVLHPGMLDMATGGAQALIPGVDLAKDFFVPLGYSSVRVFGAMPARVFSHVRCLPDTANGLAYFDVILADADGKVFAEISRFTMRKLDAAGAFGSDRVRSATVQSDTLGEALRDGIATNEGLEALDRIMAQPSLTQIIASSVDVNAWNEKLRITRAAETVEAADSVEGFERPPGAPEYVAPSTGAERVLAKVWSDLLGYQSIGVQDNFFDMGGNSLLGVRLFAAIRKRFSVSLPLATLFEAQTIADLAKLLAEPDQDTVAAGGAWSPLVCLRPGKPGHTPVYFIHGSRGNVLVFKAFADRMPLEQPVYALQAAGVDGKMMPDQTIEVMAERYLSAIRQVQPKGPYMLAGYSGGGVIAYEITRRLKAMDEATSMLMLIDTLEPSQMRTNVSMLDRFRNFHRIRLSRFFDLPAAVWTYKLKPRIRRMMGVKEFGLLRTPLEQASDLVDAAYKNAQWAYETPALETDAVLIRATDARMQFLRSGPTLGWNRFVKGSIRRFDVDAEHDFVFEGKALSQLVAAFEESIAANRPS